jgi:putative transposase
MSKLDESKVRYILRKSRNGTGTGTIAKEMNVSARWIRKLCARYRNVDLKEVAYPMRMGRRPNGMLGRREESAVLTYRQAAHLGATELEGIIEEATGIRIPHNTIHDILKSEGMANSESKKGGKRRWVRYERTYSNSMWHTDYKQLDGGRWFLCYEDDASRFVTGYGVFEGATTDNALKVLDGAIARHGKPASILTDHGSQFYANEAEARKRGESEFEKRLVELDIRHILARVKHPQTNGKLERIHGEIQRKLPEFEAILMRTSEPIDLFMKWYNYERPHMSLDYDRLETPWEAFQRKMPIAGTTVVDEQTKEEYAVE